VVFGMMIEFFIIKKQSFNFLSFRSGLFTPDEAFEYIVQMQIAKFEDPVMKCVDMVVSEILSIIHEATKKVRFDFFII
jgi:dynamin GTPase